jgi:hypothetical protein
MRGLTGYHGEACCSGRVCRRSRNPSVEKGMIDCGLDDRF